MAYSWLVEKQEYWTKTDQGATKLIY